MPKEGGGYEGKLGLRFGLVKVGVLVPPLLAGLAGVVVKMGERDMTGVRDARRS